MDNPTSYEQQMAALVEALQGSMQPKMADTPAQLAALMFGQAAGATKSNYIDDAIEHDLKADRINLTRNAALLDVLGKQKALSDEIALGEGLVNALPEPVRAQLQGALGGKAVSPSVRAKLGSKLFEMSRQQGADVRAQEQVDLAKKRLGISEEGLALRKRSEERLARTSAVRMQQAARKLALDKQNNTIYNFLESGGDLSTVPEDQRIEFLASKQGIAQAKNKRIREKDAFDASVKLLDKYQKHNEKLSEAQARIDALKSSWYLNDEEEAELARLENTVKVTRSLMQGVATQFKSVTNVGLVSGGKQQSTSPIPPIEEVAAVDKVMRPEEVKAQGSLKAAMEAMDKESVPEQLWTGFEETTNALSYGFYKSFMLPATRDERSEAWRAANPTSYNIVSTIGEMAGEATQWMLGVKLGAAAIKGGVAVSRALKGTAAGGKALEVLGKGASSASKYVTEEAKLWGTTASQAEKVLSSTLPGRLAVKGVKTVAGGFKAGAKSLAPYAVMYPAMAAKDAMLSIVMSPEDFGVASKKAYQEAIATVHAMLESPESLAYLPSAMLAGKYAKGLWPKNNVLSYIGKAGAKEALVLDNVVKSLKLGTLAATTTALGQSAVQTVTGKPNDFEASGFLALALSPALFNGTIGYLKAAKQINMARNAASPAAAKLDATMERFEKMRASVVERMYNDPKYARTVLARMEKMKQPNFREAALKSVMPDAKSRKMIRTISAMSLMKGDPALKYAVNKMGQKQLTARELKTNVIDWNLWTGK